MGVRRGVCQAPQKGDRDVPRRHLHRSRLILFLALVFLSQPAFSQVDSLYGIWVPVLSPFGGERGIDPAFPEKARVVIAADRFEVFFRAKDVSPRSGKKALCRAPQYRQGWESQEEFYRINREDLSLFFSYPVDGVQVFWAEGCRKKVPRVSLYQVTPNRLLLAYRGYFCYLERATENP